MTVKELIQRLSELNEESVVRLAADPEGNGFWIIDEVDRFGVVWPGVEVISYPGLGEPR